MFESTWIKIPQFIGWVLWKDGRVLILGRWKKFDRWVGCLLATQDVCISYIPYLPISTNSEHYPIFLNSRVLSFREWYTYFHFPPPPPLLFSIFFPLFSPQTNPLDFILWWFSCITTGTSTIVMESYHDTTNTGVGFFFFFLGLFFTPGPIFIPLCYPDTHIGGN